MLIRLNTVMEYNLTVENMDTKPHGIGHVCSKKASYSDRMMIDEEVINGIVYSCTVDR